MGLIIHNVSTPDSGLGDALRTGFVNQNTMNAELYDTVVFEVIGKDLSSNDFTDAEKAKIAGIEALAQVNVPINFSDLIGAPTINSIAAFPDSKFEYVDTTSFDLPPNVQAISVRKNGNPTEFVVTNWTQTANVITYGGTMVVGDYLIIGGVYVIGSATGGSGVQSVVAGTNVTVDNTDPLNPIVNATGGGGGGATNLGYTPSATNGIVTSDTGTDATLPAATTTNAGLLLPAEKTLLSSLPVIISDSTPSSLVTASGVNTLVKTYTLPNLAGKKILRFNFKAARTLTGTAARILVSLTDTVIGSTSTLAFTNCGTTSKIFVLQRVYPFNGATGNIAALVGNSPFNDDGAFSVDLTQVAYSTVNPMQLEIFLLDNSSSVSIQIYSALIEIF